MKQSDRSLILWMRIGACAAPLAGLTYVFGFWVDLGGQSAMWFALAFPPTLLLACISLVVFIGRGRTSPALQTALICSALAVGTFLIMITVQSSLRVTLLADARALDDGQAKVAAQWAVRAMNQTQLAFDIAWDVWISMATAAYGLGMLGRSRSLFERLA
ncbi:MAG: hypothetical protein HKN37_11015, partial [Rhodothermales bacterium]|nr:hypothetical protein [Rhodothermales bacterium]